MRVPEDREEAGDRRKREWMNKQAMRNGQNKRMRGRNNRKGQNPLTRVYESNGPDVKIRGTASHVAEKYIQTPRGIFPLRMFFTGGTENADGEAMSWDAVKAKLGEIINNEDKGNPLSDDEIVINQWLADDLRAEAGDELQLTYLVLGPGQHLDQKQNKFKIRRVVPRISC